MVILGTDFSIPPSTHNRFLYFLQVRGGSQSSPTVDNCTYRTHNKVSTSINIQITLLCLRENTIDAIFVVPQLQEKNLAVNKWLYMALVVLEESYLVGAEKTGC